MDLVIREINRLSDDYDRCPDFQLKQQILSDIALLKDALMLLEDDIGLETKPGEASNYN